MRKPALRLALPILVAAPVALSIQTPAQALVQECPSVTGTWISRDVANGYRLCSLENSSQSEAYVQIVDLKAGARVVVRSQVSSGLGTANAQYVRRTARDWWNYTLNYTYSPTGGSLQAVTNASFFTSTSTSTTALSFPAKKDGTLETPGANPDNYSKRMFGLYASGSKAYLANFNYTGNVASTVGTYMSSVNTGLVGYFPDGGPVSTESTRRTYVGVRDTDADGAYDRVYILATRAGWTSAKAVAALRDNFSSSANIQLDGGGSTQLYSGNEQNVIDSTPCLIGSCRGVPNILAVYAAS